MSFRVSSVVSDDSAWGQRGMGGYSSVGRLVTDRQDSDLEVECVRADDEIPPDREITFVKLDLRGDELNALKGMARLLPRVSLMWVEFMGSMEVLDHLTAQGFMIFDTEYFFRREPSAEAEANFAVSQASVKLSTGDSAWTGFKRTPWRSFESEFHHYRDDLSLGWTDLVCVNRARLDEFQRAAQFL